VGKLKGSLQKKPTDQQNSGGKIFFSSGKISEDSDNHLHIQGTCQLFQRYRHVITSEGFAGLLGFDIVGTAASTNVLGWFQTWKSSDDSAGTA